VDADDDDYTNKSDAANQQIESSVSAVWWLYVLHDSDSQSI
jgi:hypothetical protein